MKYDYHEAGLWRLENGSIRINLNGALRRAFVKNQQGLLRRLCAGGLARASAPGALGQTKVGKHVKVPVVPARPEDVSSPERIVLADYESISGGGGVPR